MGNVAIPEDSHGSEKVKRESSWHGTVAWVLAAVILAPTFWFILGGVIFIGDTAHNATAMYVYTAVELGLCTVAVYLVWLITDRTKKVISEIKRQQGQDVIKVRQSKGKFFELSYTAKQHTNRGCRPDSGDSNVDLTKQSSSTEQPG